ncbi:MAG: ADP-ribosylglycohydrolase family protein [Erythrobacter sp.]|nr:ADP-ribosylglycohydrolase family protein [Erythrobacter sp.]
MRSSGYVAHSFEAALWCAGQGGDFRQLVLCAANLGDDADTTAAITGQLIGALVGETGIRAEWLDRLAWHERIARLADRLMR